MGMDYYYLINFRCDCSHCRRYSSICRSFCSSSSLLHPEAQRRVSIACIFLQVNKPNVYIFESNSWTKYLATECTFVINRHFERLCFVPRIPAWEPQIVPFVKRINETHTEHYYTANYFHVFHLNSFSAFLTSGHNSDGDVRFQWVYLKCLLKEKTKIPTWAFSMVIVSIYKSKNEPKILIAMYTYMLSMGNVNKACRMRSGFGGL